MALDDPSTQGEKSRSSAGFIVESGKPLSQSLLWTIQRRYFEGQGIDAWRKNIVPHYITSNPYTAQAYARVVLGYLRDCRPSLDPQQPVYMVELGAGAGRFAFHFLHKFQALLARSPFPNLPFCYVLTDLAEPNLAFWQNHPALQEWIAAGRLDFARFDAGTDGEIRLRHSGVTLAPGTLKNPLVLIANYFFDSLPQDAFQLEEEGFKECLVTLTSSQAESDPFDPSVLLRLSIRFDSHPCRSDYYQDPDLDGILESYQRNLNSSYLLFPTEGIRCLRTLISLSGERMLLLSGDTGIRRLEEWEGRGAPDIHIHGSFSLRVNYHAIGQYIETLGGRYFSTEHRPLHLTVCAFALGESPTGFAETGLAFADAIEHSGPDDFFMIKSGIEKNYTAFELEELLAYLRFSGWDGRLFLDCHPALLEKAPSATDSVRDELTHALERIWENYYHLGEERDLPFNAGVLLYRLGRTREALVFFERSLDCYGPSPSTLYNAAMCLAQQRQFGAATARVKECLAIEPTFKPAISLLKQLQKYRTKLAPR